MHSCNDYHLDNVNRQLVSSFAHERERKEKRQEVGQDKGERSKTSHDLFVAVSL